MNLKFDTQVTAALAATLLAITAGNARADNPIVPTSFPDVNVTIVGDTAYAFGGTDLFPKQMGLNEFVMPYWRVYSSKDLVNWTKESELHPTQTYIGPSTDCWAGHGIYRDGKWFWYFSNQRKNIGVATSDSIKGPWKDALGRPLLDEADTPSEEYDPCVLIDDDGRAYLTSGVYIHGGYYLTELNPDMISIKTAPRRLIIEELPKNGIQQPTDASFLHKTNGRYYLSGRQPYGIATTPYGPYKFGGQQGYGGHGGFFDFNGQNFVNFTLLKPETRSRYRYTGMAYLHHRDNGTISPIAEPLIRNYGVGQYQANWEKIEAEWFMKIGDAQKREKPGGGFEVRGLRQGSQLNYPNVHQMPAKAKLRLNYSAMRGGGTVEVRAGTTANCPIIGSATIKATGGWNRYSTLDVPLAKGKETRSVLLTFKGKGDELMRLNWLQVRPR